MEAAGIEPAQIDQLEQAIRTDVLAQMQTRA